MKHTVRNSVLAALVVMAATLAQSARADDIQADSQQAISNFKAKDPTLQRFFDTSVGYVIFPNVGKGGLIVGGAHGDGLVYEHGRPIGKATLTQASIGAQVGGTTYAELIFFETPQALQDFKESKFTMSAEVTAVAAAEGVAKTAKYQDGVAVFTMPKKGLMAAAAVGGQKFKFEPLQ